MLNWAKQFSILIYLDNNNYPSVYGRFECLLATGPADERLCAGINDLPILDSEFAKNPDWYFGHICYDYKNVVEPKLSSGHAVQTGFPLLSFFRPHTVCYINCAQTTFTIESFDDPESIYQSIFDHPVSIINQDIPPLDFVRKIEQHQYIDTIEKLRAHIADGDCYEVNFCNEAYCIGADIDPMQVFRKLNVLSPAPFAAYYRLYDRYLMCASPERYIRKNGRQLLSQPIKGTARRGNDTAEDMQLKENLQNDIKERAENVMIVDLVRNDLARYCETGSVRVDELFGIYSFPQVHQMISTVSGTLLNNVGIGEAIKSTFPMGSMTGAPKFKVMEIIEKYELSRRELFSGTVGYITPSGDFDFNVVIRSLFYNEATGYLSFQTGGAITYDSKAEQEWEEMLLKAWAMERIFAGNTNT